VPIADYPQANGGERWSKSERRVAPDNNAKLKAAN